MWPDRVRITSICVQVRVLMYPKGTPDDISREIRLSNVKIGYVSQAAGRS